MFNVKVDYPSIDEEKRILSMTAKDESGEIHKVLSGKAIVNLQKLESSVPVGDFVIDFVTRLVRHTAQGPDRAGLRPQDGRLKRRGSGGAVPDPGRKAFAAMEGRFSVAIDDIRKGAEPVLRHRIGTNFQAQAEGKTSEDIIAMLLKTVGEPEPPKYGAKKRLRPSPCGIAWPIRGRDGTPRAGRPAAESRPARSRRVSA